ncbi:hypothetical protein FBEOM_4176 [Fusarium beomiforme]|uniref:Secreted protein CSS2 C-terminal domain-containing protein n=1 Tax=Fusarium beomiforme TaxID=44412 RepID=A0A9P5E050_9HYPO|nr:hypothetical protein FBEOM_4176 [Fusarium beomiforme]
MRLKPMILLGLTSLPISTCWEPILEETGSASLPRPSAVSQEMHLELLHALEQLQHSTTENAKLKKRKSIYERAWAALGPSPELLDATEIIWLQISSTIKRITGIEACGHFSDYAGPKEQIYYQYQTDDGHCDTVMEQFEIRRAIQHRIETQGASLSETECLDLTETGVWKGHLLIGPTKGFDYDIECGPKLIVIPVSMTWDLDNLPVEGREDDKAEDAKDEL